jgi:hypothetical protein
LLEDIDKGIRITQADYDACVLVYLSLQSKGTQRTKARLTRIIKTASKLRSLVPHPEPELDQLIAESEWFLNPKGDPPVEGVKIRRLPESPQIARLRKLGLSPFEAVAGWCLPKVFEANYGRPAGYSRDEVNDTVRGDFIDFADIALRLLGITNSGKPYGRRAIEAALTKVRRLKSSNQ